MKEKTKKVLKQLALYICVFFILIGIYMILLTLTSMIPSSLLEKHVVQSSETLLEDGETKKYDLKYKEEGIFTFTDALMINTAYSIDSNHPIKSFITARKNYIPGQTKQVYGDSQYNLGANEKYINKDNGDLYQTKELYGLMHGENIEDSYEYARYWHGYLAILRPLLVIGNYSTIRVILFILTLICVTTLIVLLGKKTNKINACIYGIGLLAIQIFVVSQSINEILIFLIAFISNIILLLRKEKIKNIGIFFFIIGSISSFIDLLTAPLVTLGLTAITYFLLLQEERKGITIKQYIMEIFKISIAWCLGYGLTWISKWVITEVLFDRPIISQAIEQAKFRTNQTSRTLIQLINKIIKFLSRETIATIFAIGIIYLIAIAIKNFKEKIDFKDNIKKCVPYMIIFCFPIVWYIALKQHSYVHAFFTYRILVISIICLLIIFSKILEKKKEEK